MILMIQAAYCQEGNMEKLWPLVLEITQASTRGENPLFQKVIEDAVTLEMEQAGLRVVSRRELFSQGEIDSPGEAASKGEVSGDSATTGTAAVDVFELAREAEAEFALLSTYSIVGSTIQIDFSWFDIGENRSTAPTSRSSRMDLALDRTIREAVTEILESEKARIVSLIREVERKEKPQITDGPTAAIEAAREPRAEIKLDKRFEVSAGLSPFIATGDVSEFFKLGLMPVLYGGYRLPLQNGILTIGLIAGINIFQAEGLIASSENLLIPVGPDIRYTLSPGGTIDLYARLAGGPALFIVNVEGADRHQKILPFATAGIGFSLLISETFGFAVEASYAVYFDTAGLLMGFTPGIYLFVRF
jgi:hypothetical protein